MEFNELMRQFAAKFGIDDISIEDDVAALEIDGMAFGFICDPSEETLTVVADLGQGLAGADGVFSSMMLKANFLFRATKGATLFQNPENDSFGMQQMFRLADLDVETLSARVESLANVADEWKAVVAGVKIAEDAAAERKAEETAVSPFASDGDFLRV